MSANTLEDKLEPSWKNEIGSASHQVMTLLGIRPTEPLPCAWQEAHTTMLLDRLCVNNKIYSNKILFVSKNLRTI